MLPTRATGRDLSKACFPLEGILSAEWNFSLFVSSQAEKDNGKFRSFRIIPSSRKRPQWWPTGSRACRQRHIEPSIHF